MTFKLKNDRAKQPRVKMRNGIVDLSDLIPDEEWNAYRSVVEAAQARNLKFALGGGLAFSAYSPRCRNTKDLDLFIRPSDREQMIALLTEVGGVDYYDEKPYDRTWIYRGKKESVIVDLIWTMPNHRMEVDEEWVTQGQKIEIKGVQMRVLPVEELLWSKLYVMQRDRCDWPDILNILYAKGQSLDWNHLLERVNEDAWVLGGVMSIYRWLCPSHALEVPSWVWDRVGLAPPKDDPRCINFEEEDPAKPVILDTRDWFGPVPEAA